MIIIMCIIRYRQNHKQSNPPLFATPQDTSNHIICVRGGGKYSTYLYRPTRVNHSCPLGIVMPARVCVLRLFSRDAPHPLFFFPTPVWRNLYSYIAFSSIVQEACRGFPSVRGADSAYGCTLPTYQVVLGTATKILTEHIIGSIVSN